MLIMRLMVFYSMRLFCPNSLTFLLLLLLRIV
jgi:hypothetical protein